MSQALSVDELDSRRIEREQDEWRSMADACLAMAARVPELHRLRSSPTPVADGFGPGGATGPGSKGEHSDPTGATASTTVDAHGSEEPDSVADALASIRRSMRVARRELRAAQRTDSWLTHRADARRGRQPSGADCLACGRYVTGARDDRLRMGLCDSCRKAWVRWAEGQADASHVLFRKARRLELEAEPVAMGE